MNVNSLNHANDNQSRGQASDFKEKATAMWAGIPLFVKFVIITTIVLYLLTWITPIDMVLMNIPNQTFFKLQIWRLFSSVFLTPSLIGIIFAFLAWVPDAVRLENTSGTIRYMLNFLVNAFLINLVYCLTIIAISIVYKDAINSPSSGLWPLIMAEISMLCLANPDNLVTMFFIPLKFSAKYYPWALFAFFTVMNMSFQVDILIGIFYGHLFFYFLRNYIQFSDNFVIKVESYSLIKAASKITAFIPLQVSTLNSSYNGYQGQQTLDNNQQSAFTRGNEPPSTGFKGTGTVLGNL